MASDDAHQLRRERTDPQRCLWKHLGAHRFAGEKFRRQVPMGPYIVDFVFHRSGLIVEVDGGQHAGREERDLERTRWLEGRGYRVIRSFPCSVGKRFRDVLRSLDGLRLPG